MQNSTLCDWTPPPSHHRSVFISSFIYGRLYCVNTEKGLDWHSLSHSSTVPDKPYGFCGRKEPWKKKIAWRAQELRSCVKMEMGLDSHSLSHSSPAWFLWTWSTMEKEAALEVPPSDTVLFPALVTIIPYTFPKFPNPQLSLFLCRFYIVSKTSVSRSTVLYIMSFLSTLYKFSCLTLCVAVYWYDFVNKIM